MPSDLTIRASHIIVPILVQKARVLQTITTTSLSEKIGLSIVYQAPQAIEYIRESICLSRNYPDLTSIIEYHETASLITGPSHSIRTAAFLCPDWDRLQNELGIRPIPPSPQELEEEGKLFARYQANNTHPVDKDLQRDKEALAEQPDVFGLHTWKLGEVDYMFISGDTCDVLFWRDGLPVIARVKTRHRGDQICGIYELIKQRSLLEAEKSHGAPLAVQCFLVANEIADGVQNYAEKFNIRCLTFQSK